jgi:tRNA nucleotidyltransferase (CCA-adding enzyme)
LSYISDLELLNAYTVKPVVDGNRLLKEIGRKPGPWLTDAVKALLRWQFRNPKVSDPAEGIKEVVDQFKEKEK